MGHLKECDIHLDRLMLAIDVLEQSYVFPLSQYDYDNILNNKQNMAYCDQLIYRFSKIQDCMGSKLFKSIVLYQGDSTNKSFLDMLNQLERMDIIDVNKWFELRDLRNDIAHNYDNDASAVINMLNTIVKAKYTLVDILNAIKKMADSHEVNA